MAAVLKLPSWHQLRFSDDPEQVAAFSEPQFPQLYREVVVIQSLWRATRWYLPGAFKSSFPLVL